MWLVAFAFQTLAHHLAVTAPGFRLFAGAPFRWLFKGLAKFHFAENAFTLQFFLQHAQGLINIIVSDNYLYDNSPPECYGLCMEGGL